MRLATRWYRSRVSGSPVSARRRYGGFAAPGALFGALWVAAMIEKQVAAGLDVSDVVAPLAVLAGIGVTWMVTAPGVPAAPPGGRVRAQIGFLAAYTVFSIASGLHAHGALESPVFAPRDWLAQWVAPLAGI